ncbi:hypothetical protein [Nocardioides panacihumi]|uniref:hypothetical protein n=1 Tax=Nocardioides panacihumi TaxID=400774 RepID=UPI0031DEE0E9
MARLGANGWATLGESSLVEGSTWARVGVDPTGRIIAGGERAYNTGEAGTLVTVGPDGVDNVLFELPGNDTTIVDMSPTGEIVAAWHEDRTVYTAEYVAGRWSSPRRAHSATLGSTSVYGMRIHSLTDGRWLVSWHQSSDSSAEEGTWTSLRGVDGTWREEYAGSTCFVADAVAAAPRGSLDIIGGCTDSVVGRRLDVEGPTARMLGSTLLPTYAPSVFATGLDHVGGVGAASFEFASRSVSWSGGPWTGWSSIGSDTVHTDGISGIWHSSEKPGRTYCTRVRAVDSGGNVGEWSSNQTCYSAAIDDRQMRRSRGWREGRHDYWQHTFLTTSRKGATLRLPGVHARRFALLADATPGGGRVEVWFGGRLLKRVTLRSSTSSNEYRNVLLGVLPTARTATLVIRIVSKGKPVRIDGIHATPL